MKTFEINYTKPKRKSRKRRYEEICKDQSNQPNIDTKEDIEMKDLELEPELEPEVCKHQIYNNYEAGEMICLKCHVVIDRIYVNENFKLKNADMLIWNRDYDKVRWILDTLDYINGEHENCFTDSVWVELLEEIPNPCTYTDVYKVFHKYKLTDYWTCFAHYVSIPIEINKEVLANTIEYSDLKYTKYRISFMYLFYKFTQMINKEKAKTIPFKGTKAWIKKTDVWWKEICEEKKWDYYDSEMNEMTWDKEMIIACLKFFVLPKDPNTMSDVQSILFDKHYYNISSAQQELRKMGFMNIKPAHITAQYIRFRIKDPEEFKVLRTKYIKEGISFIIGVPK